MRIVFILIGNSRRSNYLDGDTIRYGKGGGSGTDGSTIIIAEQLAKAGHEVVITSDRLEPLLEQTYAAQGLHFNAGKTVRGVTYTDIFFEGVENREFDIEQFKFAIQDKQWTTMKNRIVNQLKWGPNIRIVS